MRSEPGGTSRDGAVVGLVVGSGLLLPCLLGASVPGRLDLIDFFWPMKAYTALRWRLGELPLWNPLSGLGEPWLAQLQSGALYPGDLVFLLPFPACLLAGILLHLAIGAAGMAAYVRDQGVSRLGALVAAAVYAGGGGFVSLLPVYNNACTAAFLPWMLLGARLAAQGRAPVLLAFSFAVSVLAGEPLLALCGAGASVLMALLTRAEGEPPARQAAKAPRRLLLGLLLGGGVAAAALLPFAQLVAGSERLRLTTAEETFARSVTASDLADLVLPPSQAAVRNPSANARGGYLLSLVEGPLVLLLCAAALAGLPGRPRLLAGLALIAGVGLLLSLGPPGVLGPVLLRIGVLPGVRYTARLFVFVHLLLAVAAGAGLDGWLFGRFGSVKGRTGGKLEPAALAEDALAEGARARRLAVAVGVASLGLLLLGLWDAQRRDALRSALLFGGCAIGAGLLALGRSGALRAAAAGWGVLGLLVGSLAFSSRDPLSPVPAAPLKEVPEIVKGLPSGGRTLVTALGPSVLATTTLAADGSFTEDTPRRSRAMLAGYAGLLLGVPTVESASPLGSPPRTFFRAALRSSGGLLALADVRHVVTPYALDDVPGAVLARRVAGVHRYDRPAGLGRAFFPSRARVIRDEAALRAALSAPRFDPEAEVLLETPLPLPRTGVPTRAFRVAKVLEEEPERLVLETASSVPSVLVLTRSWDAGWKATCDGQPAPIVKADVVMMAIAVPAGEHRFVLRYRPTSFLVGAAVSVVSLLVLLGLWLDMPPRPPV